MMDYYRGIVAGQIADPHERQVRGRFRMLPIGNIPENEVQARERSGIFDVVLDWPVIDRYGVYSIPMATIKEGMLRAKER